MRRFDTIDSWNLCLYSGHYTLVLTGGYVVRISQYSKDERGVIIKTPQYQYSEDVRAEVCLKNYVEGWMPLQDNSKESLQILAELVENRLIKGDGPLQLAAYFEGMRHLAEKGRADV